MLAPKRIRKPARKSNPSKSLIAVFQCPVLPIATPLASLSTQPMQPLPRSIVHLALWGTSSDLLPCRGSSKSWINDFMAYNGVSKPSTEAKCRSRCVLNVLFMAWPGLGLLIRSGKHGWRFEHVILYFYGS
jgi:hypothetical protein